jgi:peptide deformylase
MAVRPILTAPDPRLKALSQAVETVDASTRRLIDDMVESMYAADGIGLAAVQIGVAQRVIVMDLDQREGKKNPRHFVNPVITWRSDDLATFEEGCLSVPEIWEDVERAARIKAEYLDRDGKRHEFEADGLLATCLQHEMDHLEGILFIDHLSKLKRSIALRKLQKAKRLKETG